MSKKRVNYKDQMIGVSSIKVPLRMFVERRSNVRVSLGKNYVILRVPFLTLSGTEKHLKTAQNWLEKLYLEKPELLSRYDLKSLKDKNSVTLLGKDVYTVKIEEEGRSDGTLHASKGLFRVVVPKSISDYDKRILVRKLLSRIAAKKYKSFVKNRLEELNNEHFHKIIKGLTLRYNSTNWGSCSNSGKINISTRSLLLPLEVFDYILVHELSHLVEMNHSEAFWKVVKNVMPQYKKHENWLKVNGSKLDF